VKAKANYKYSEVGIAGSLLILLFTGSGLSQERQRRPRRPPVEPLNLVYDKKVEGVEIPILETYIRSSDGLYIAAVVSKPKGEGPFPALIITRVTGRPRHERLEKARAKPRHTNDLRMNASLEEPVRRSYYLALSMMFQSGESFQQSRKGFGFVQVKPATAFAPIFAKLDELGD
jgi:hypothetical protein